MAYTTINKSSSYFNTVLWTGTGVSRNQTGVGFDPDWVWIKCRSDATTDNVLFDRVRTAGQRLVSNDSGVEETQTGIMSAFVTDGVTLGTGNASNGSAKTYVMWNWLANNTSGSSNTAGTITSTVSANTTSGFSIVTYTGAGGASTVGHGLGVIPRMIILKGRSNARIWVIGHGSLGWTKYLSFDAAAVETNNYWNDTTPTSSVFSVFNSANVNGSGETYVAYCFAEKKGYSKISSYTGNGSADGTFIYTGFKPAFIIFRRTSTGDNWVIKDSIRDPNNVAEKRIYPNQSAAEDTSVNGAIDILSNGFKNRSSNDLLNQSGDTYIYMAFAENPFVTSGGIPVTAR